MTEHPDLDDVKPLPLPACILAWLSISGLVGALLGLCAWPVLGAEWAQAIGVRAFAIFAVALSWVGLDTARRRREEAAMRDR